MEHEQYDVMKQLQAKYADLNWAMQSARRQGAAVDRGAEEPDAVAQSTAAGKRQVPTASCGSSTWCRRRGDADPERRRALRHARLLDEALMSGVVANAAASRTSIAQAR